MNEQQEVNATEASYNITNDRLKVWFDDRLPNEQYKAARALQFQFWHGTGCFSAVWSPEREDFILNYGIGIDEDDTPDDVESRVNRFEKYAANDEETHAAALDRAMNANTRRQHRIAEATAAKKLDEARYWHNRIAGAIRHAAYKDKPDVITRRIKRLQADQRKQERNLKQSEQWLKLWEGIPLKLKSGGYASMKESAVFLAGRDPLYFSICFTKDKYPNSTYEGPKSIWSALDDDIIEAEEAQRLAIGAHQKAIKHATRWIDHLKMRIEYETAYLEAVGGSAESLKPKPRRRTPAPKDGLKKGDIVTVKLHSNRENPITGKLVSVGPKNVKVEVPENHPNYSYYRRWSEGVYHARRSDVTKVEA